MKIYLDFDGTVVEHQYPKIGRCNFGCFEVIKKLQDAGHEIILNTYRSECNNGTLESALSLVNNDHWMLIRDRHNNPDFNIKPLTSTASKFYPNTFDWKSIMDFNTMYIDDQAPGTPLKKACMSEGMMVDWDELDKQFETHGMYQQTK